jgi:uncharacterized protein YggE
MNTSDFTNNQALRIAVVGVLAILALFLLVMTIGAAQNLGRPANPAVNVITVTGTGHANAAPDIATIDFTVTETASTVAAAQTAATKKTNDALAAVKALGIDDKDVKTTSYNVNPHYEYIPCVAGTLCPNGGSKITGYDVSQSVEVKVRDTSKAGTVLEKLGSLNITNISGPNFTQDDASATHDEARAAAIKDAQSKAQELARELGVHLGMVTSFSEGGGGYPMPVYATAYGKGGAAMDAAVPPTLPTGQNETDVTVTITYEIR